MLLDMFNLGSGDMRVAFEENLVIHWGLGYTVQLGGHGTQYFTFRDNTFVNSWVFYPGNSEHHSTVEVTNNIFSCYGAGCYSRVSCHNSPNSVFDFAYNCFWETSISGCPEGEGTIYADPLFCDPSSGDYRLDADSPCVGAGEQGSTIGAFDIGCGVTSVTEIPVPTPRLRLSVRPNPVLHGAEFVVGPMDGKGTLDIYDPLGRLVESVRPRGTFTWEPGNEAVSGIYFARLQGEGVAQVVKFVVLR